MDSVLQHDRVRTFVVGFIVSILVLMDSVLQPLNLSGSICRTWVSILVLMDSVLQLKYISEKGYSMGVSILVLMDSVLQLSTYVNETLSVFESFNPCFNGFRSSTWIVLFHIHDLIPRFNPCFNGFRSSTLFHPPWIVFPPNVSILVLMDSVLQPHSHCGWRITG